MNRRERIPTLHELKLAGRVERARALFGPGGYLSISEKKTPAKRYGPAASPAPPKQPVGLEGEEREDSQGRNSISTAVESSLQGSGGGDKRKEGKRPEENNEEHSLPPPSSAEHGRLPTKAFSGPPSPLLEETRLDGAGDKGSRRAGRTRATGGVVTTVTFTIVGGRPSGRGFTNLEQSGKVKSPHDPGCNGLACMP